MFTGIVEEVGEIVAVEPGADSAVVRVRGPRVVSDATHGASICVNGVCLTVTDHDAESFAVDVMAETLNRSSLADVQPGSKVNLERAMAADGRFGGHVVQGHVDGTGTVVAREPGEKWEVVTIALPDALARYVVEKGSICVDGVSLTVSAVDAVDAAGVSKIPAAAAAAGDVDAGHGHTFQVSLIPTTLAETTLGAAAVGTRVNLEVDVLAKYVEKMLAMGVRA